MVCCFFLKRNIIWRLWYQHYQNVYICLIPKWFYWVSWNVFLYICTYQSLNLCILICKGNPASPNVKRNPYDLISYFIFESKCEIQLLALTIWQGTLPTHQINRTHHSTAFWSVIFWSFFFVLTYLIQKLISNFWLNLVTSKDFMYEDLVSQSITEIEDNPNTWL